MTLRNRIDMILGTFVVLLMAILVINVLWQVASRYLVGHPSSFTDELAGFLLIWVGLLGSAYITGKRQHLAIDLLHNKLKPEGKRRIDRLINLLISLFALSVLIAGGSNLVYITMHLGQLSSALRLPIGYVYVVLPLSGIFIMYYAIDDLIHPKTFNSNN